MVAGPQWPSSYFRLSVGPTQIVGGRGWGMNENRKNYESKITGKENRVEKKCRQAAEIPR